MSGTGVGGSAIVASSSAPLLFDSSSSAGGTSFSLKFTAGTPHSTFLLATFPDTTGLSGTAARITVDHRDVSGTALTWVLQRSQDAFYYSASDSSWAATRTFNAMDITATSTAIERYYSQQITGVSSTGGTLTLSLGLASSGTDGRINHVYHVELYNAIPYLFRGTRIVTNGQTGSRSVDQLTLRSASSGLISQSRGTLLCRLTPNWSSTDEAGISFKPALRIGSSANTVDSWALGYRSNTTTWFFATFASGASITTSAAAGHQAAVSAGTAYPVAMRWTSTEGELGTTGRTMSIFVAGVKGADYATTNYPTDTTIYFGDNLHIPNTADVFDGAITDLTILPYCLSDDEIAAWSS